jgi:hypothetical protein
LAVKREAGDSHKPQLLFSNALLRKFIPRFERFYDFLPFVGGDNAATTNVVSPNR